MSPRTTFQSCGSSSSRVRRMKRPTRVMRASPLVAQIGVPAYSASCRIERNLHSVKVRPFSPTRSWQ
jgi:thymidine kinase